MTTSPYQGNDYNALQFRPYELPVNDILKGIVAKNAYWQQGASRVKSRYNDVLGLDLITDVNKEIVNDFTTKAQKEMQKLSAMDLSDADVQRDALNIFSPIFDSSNPISKNILYESNLVGNLNKEEGLAENSRLVDNGANYNALSHENINYQKTILRQLNRNDAWAVIGNQVETYTPSSNLAKEMIEIKKAITERVNTVPGTLGDDWYIANKTTKSIPEDVLRTAIDEMGSPALKSQIRAEGRNTFYKKILSDPQGAEQYYGQMASNLYDNNVAGLKIKHAEIKAELYNLDMSQKGAKEAQTFYQKQLEGLQSTIDGVIVQRNDYLSSLSGVGNVENLSNSLQKIDMLNEQYSINEIAKKFSYINSEQELEANGAKIAMENVNTARARLDFDKMKLEYEKKKDASFFEQVFGGPQSQNIASNYTPEELIKIGQQKVEEGFASMNNDAALVETFLSGVLKDPGTFYSVLQDNVKADVQLSDIPGLESVGVIGELSKFISSYAATKEINHPLFKVPKGATEEQVKQLVSRLTPSMINQCLPGILSDNRSFISKTLETHGGPVVSTKFRAALDNADSKRMNFNQTLLPELKRELGVYGEYIKGYSEKDIQDAYNSMPIDKKVGYYRTMEVSSGELGLSKTRKTVAVSKEEFDKINSTGYAYANGYFSKEIDYSEFKEVVEPIMYRTIGKKVVNNFGVQQSFESKNPVTDFPPVKASLAQSTEMREGLSQLLDKIEVAGAFAGMTMRTPTVGQSTTTADIMVNPKFAEELTGEEITLLKKIPIANKNIPEKWKQTTNPLDDKKYLGAYLATSSSNVKKEKDGKDSYISVVNNSNGADIIPKIVTNIQGFSTNNGFITTEQYLDNYARMKTGNQYSSFAEVLKADPTFAQEMVTSVMIQYEKSK